MDVSKNQQRFEGIATITKSIYGSKRKKLRQLRTTTEYWHQH